MRYNLSMEIAGFCPQILQPNLETAQWELKKVQFALCPKPKVDLLNPETIHDSLGGYVYKQDINKFLEQFTKPDHKSAHDKIALRVDYHPQHRHYVYNPNSSFYLDGTHSIALGVVPEDQENSFWFSLLSFCCGKDELPSIYKTRLDVGDIISSFSLPFPLITQIQGLKIGTGCPDYQNYIKARDLLSHYRWEHALVELVIDWAITEQIGAVYLLPSKNNVWQHRVHHNKEALYLRYDVTAKRCGFQLQDNGLYGINLGLYGLGEVN